MTELLLLLLIAYLTQFLDRAYKALEELKGKLPDDYSVEAKVLFGEPVKVFPVLDGLYKLLDEVETLRDDLSEKGKEK